jgi:hypothetical protein
MHNRLCYESISTSITRYASLVACCAPRSRRDQAESCAHQKRLSLRVARATRLLPSAGPSHAAKINHSASSEAVVIAGSRAAANSFGAHATCRAGAHVYPWQARAGLAKRCTLVRPSHNRSVNGTPNCCAVWFPPLRSGARYVQR